MSASISKSQEEYKRYVAQKMQKTKTFSGCVKAFFAGGLICVIGQLISDAGKAMGLQNEQLSSFTAIVMVFLGATLTGIGVYDKIGQFAGAGSIVPITGFANSIVSPAMEYRREGLVMGIGAKMFIIAGPVLVYGYGASIVAGIVYWLFEVL
ncbi:MAG: stage V sporulation protein AC [Christensenellales bacterium]